MRLRNLLDYLDSRTTNGASFDELKNKFDDVESEDIQRLVKSALDLSEIKKDGQGRGVRYYGINFDIVRIKNEAARPLTNEGNKVDGAIDISKCSNTKEKIQTVLASTHCLACLLYTSPSPRDRTRSRMPSSA